MDLSARPADPREANYAAVLQAAQRRAFEWGVHDCVLFTAAAVRARTGREVLAELGIFPAWRTALQAAAAIESAGGLRHALTQLFGEPGPALSGCTGDVAIVTDPGTERELLGVCHGGLVLAPALDGMHRFQITDALAVWHVR